MTDWFRDLNPIAQAALAGGFTWFITAVGAAFVLVTRRMSQALLDAMLGFAAGVMIAASVWSLIIPAIEEAEGSSLPAWLPAAVGIVLGAGALRIADRFLPHLHMGLPRTEAEGVDTPWRRSTLLVLAITLHNIPEGLAVGVAFGAVREATDSDAAFAAALGLAIGIGLQNLPEGIAVALPLRGSGASQQRSFFYGQVSAAVEPIAAVLGAAAVIIIAPVLPYALAFAAGAMLFVVIEELIPESQGAGNTDLATLFTLGGFVFMMVLDVALG